jgi:hypothetical protein
MLSFRPQKPPFRKGKPLARDRTARISDWPEFSETARLNLRPATRANPRRAAKEKESSFAVERPALASGALTSHGVNPAASAKSGQSEKPRFTSPGAPQLPRDAFSRPEEHCRRRVRAVLRQVRLCPKESVVVPPSQAAVQEGQATRAETEQRGFPIGRSFRKLPDQTSSWPRAPTHVGSERKESSFAVEGPASASGALTSHEKIRQRPQNPANQKSHALRAGRTSAPKSSRLRQSSPRSTVDAANYVRRMSLNRTIQPCRARPSSSLEESRTPCRSHHRVNAVRQTPR